MRQALSRREFLNAAVAAGTSVAAAGSLQPTFAQADEPQSANDKLNLAVIGVAGKGRSNWEACRTENIVALCDIDSERLAPVAAEFPDARTFTHYQDVFAMSNLDGVICSTPDHQHAFVSAAALRLGLGVYCEKPLTHSVYEARTMRRLTASSGAVTQMGNQIHSGDNYRRVVELVRAGVIGPIRRVHVWQGGGVRTGVRVTDGMPPATVDYDQWIGPAPYRPFHESHFHFNWRYWWDFGGGQLADFGCHYMDLPFWALDLAAPQTVVAVGEKAHEGDNETPGKLRVDYEFPARADQPPVHLTWYHGGWMPEGAEVYDKKSAVLFEGENGRLLADYGTKKLFMQAGSEAKPVTPWIAPSLGQHGEWLNAIRTGGTTSCNFEYGGTLTEAVLLGNVSYRAGGKKFTWDAENMEIPDCPEAVPYLRRDYREGWEL